MNEHTHSSTVRLLRRLAVLGGTAVLLLTSTAPAHAAPTPTPTKRPNTPATVAAPSPLPANAPKPGVKPAAVPSRVQRAAAAPATAASATLPPATCASAGGSQQCDLWALSGTLQVAGAPPAGLPVWGFQSGSATAAGGPAAIPGPTLVVREDQPLSITLHNQLPAGAGNLSLEIPAAPVPPDTSGVPTGDGVTPGPNQSFRSYSFGKLAPGSYLYQAGPTGGAPRQIKMGLAGLLVVRPASYTTAAMSAYGNVNNDGFNAEAVAELNEFDPEFNANPTGADPIDFHPTLFLLNGRTFDPANPAAGKIDVGPGQIVLLRYANLGGHDRGLTVLNQRQRVLADDSHVLRNPGDVATKWLTAGQVSDSFVAVDPQAPLNARIPIFESGYHFSNGPSLGLGGELTYLDVVQGLGGSPSGPVSSVTVVPPNVAGSSKTIAFTGTQDLVFSGTVTATSGGVTAAEWFLDSPGTPGQGQSFSSGTNAACTPAPSGGTYSFTCTIKAASLDALVAASPPVDGDHIIWVHGQDAGGWGVVSGDVFTFNVSGPLTTALSVHVTPTNGSRQTDVANGAGPGGANLVTADLVILGTAAASLPDWVVLGGEYCLDSTSCASGKGTPVVTSPGPVKGAPNTPDPCVPPPPQPGPPSTPPPPTPPGGGSIVSFCSAVPASVLSGLNAGEHTLYVHAYEAPNQAGGGAFGAAPGRWGDYTLPDAQIKFVIDRTGPSVSGPVKLDPNPNNGRQNSSGNLNFLDSLQVTATLDDSKSGGSNVSYAEVFVTATTAPAPAAADYGKGAEMIPGGGAWDSPTKLANAYIPLAVLTAYPEGHVRFWVHGRDIAGNWGAWSSGDLTLDRTAPQFDYGAGATPANGSQLACATGCSITLKATDPASGGVNTNIVQAEWFTDPNAHLTCDPAQAGCVNPDVTAPGDPGQGNGHPIQIATPGTSITATFNVPAQPVGMKIVFRVRDLAGNWSRETMVVTR